VARTREEGQEQSSAHKCAQYKNKNKKRPEIKINLEGGTKKLALTHKKTQARGCSRTSFPRGRVGGDAVEVVKDQQARSLGSGARHGKSEGRGDRAQRVAQEGRARDPLHGDGRGHHRARAAPPRALPRACGGGASGELGCEAFDEGRPPGARLPHDLASFTGA
jgi:hypothetical protein